MERCETRRTKEGITTEKKEKGRQNFCVRREKNMLQQPI
jgi:hypothetical protein